MSTIRSDTESTDKIVQARLEVTDGQLPQSCEKSEDFEETDQRQPISRDTESKQLNVLPQGNDLNVSHDVVETDDLQRSISKSSLEQNLVLINNAVDFANLNAPHNQASEKESQNVPGSKLSHGTVSLSKNANQDIRSDPDLKETLDLIVQDSAVLNKTEDTTNITQISSESIVTENDLRSIESVASNTHNASDDSQSLDLNTHDASDTDHKLTDLAYLDRNTSEVSEVRSLIESENSESLTETDVNDTLNEDGQENNSTTDTQHSIVDSSHSALKQEVNSDPDREGHSNLHLHIRSFRESVKEDDQEMPPKPLSEKPKPQLVSTPSSQRIATERPPPVKKEKVKKVRREVKDTEKAEKRQLVNGDRTESNDFSQVQVEEETEVTLIDSTDELPPLTNGHRESPELPPIEIPPLPEYVEEKKDVKLKENKRTLIKPIPKLKEAKLPPPPTLKGPKKSVLRTLPKKKGRVPSAEAPVTKEELSDMTDPLDFLTKYCIIHMDRLPFYERIFSNIVETQTPRYERVRPLSPRTGMPLPQSEMPQWGKHEINMFHDLIVISRGQDPEKIGLSPPEQYLEKICYTLEILTDKRKDICAVLGELESTKTKKLAEKAKEVIKDIVKPNFTPKAPKKGKKKKKKKGQQSVEDFEAPPPRLTLADITDEIIVSRIDEKTMKMLCKEADICQINLEMERCNEKLDNIEERIVHLDGEKNILGMYCMEVYFLEQLNNQKPVDFRRAQSALYNKIHPHPDVEMNVDELEGSLQIINNNLLSTKEFEYLFHVLNLPGRRKLNFQLFSIVAALSEKVTQMDPVVRKLINKMDYHALDHKMNRSKDLFALICDGEPTPRGNATASNLAVELTAGGLTPEHIKVVLSKFNREGSGYIDFMDFVMYIPLFIEIHQRIVQNPLDVKFTF
ncbi:uncharacterized protein LOC110465814 isoform X2 [Mizuhopecten yessoensis]|uniref:uncharacterized protein LOC110465814 isoform X2 n=1 Tax=Mizuhopecten yessoensis TaxID=6573 RepID=UPI000B45D490|nr:uncharacterized protein LOC110465814 isoform X2 [Mizuhopecten yessoensis]